MNNHNLKRFTLVLTVLFSSYLSFGQETVKLKQIPDHKETATFHSTSDDKQIVKQSLETSVEDDVKLVCNTDGMSENQIELRKITKLESDIANLEKSGSKDVQQLSKYRSMKSQKESNLVHSMTQEDFMKLNVEEQKTFLELVKNRDADKAAEYYSYYKEGLKTK